MDIWPQGSINLLPKYQCQLVKLFKAVGSGDTGRHFLFHTGACNSLVDHIDLLINRDIWIQDKPVSDHCFYKSSSSLAYLSDQGFIGLFVLGLQDFQRDIFTILF